MIELKKKINELCRQAGQPEKSGRLSGYAWLPIPLLLLVIAGLWVTSPQITYESPILRLLLNLVFTWLVSLCIGFLTARSFLDNGQPGLLMLGCGALLWGFSSLAASRMMDASGNLTVTVHNLGILWAALCHLGGLLWHERLSRPGRWLAAGYAAVLAAVVLIVWAAKAGWTPIFFVQGHGGTLVRQIVLLLSITLFLSVACLMVTSHRRQPSQFFYWYGLGLALLALGLAGVMLQTAHGSPLNWVGRLTQYLGGAYLFIAALMTANSQRTWKISLTEIEETWQTYAFQAKRRQQPLGLALRYGLGVILIATALGLRLAIESRFGPGLPTYITFYPVVMAAAILGGFGPGMATTAVTSLVVSYWLLPPVGQFSIAAPIDRLGLLIFIAMGAGMSALAGFYQHQRLKAAAYDREVALRDTKARLKMFAEATFEGIVETDAGRIADCNEQFARMLGYSVAELKGRKIIDRIAPEDRDRVTRTIQQRQNSVFEHAMVRKDGTPIIVEAHDRPGPLGSTIRFTAIRDITERKQAEEQIRASLAEKEVLLREVHHRVKNNLQVISSLISLQADSLTDERMRAVFSDVRDRVRAMALVHEKLYQTGNLAQLNWAEYAASLLQYLWRSHGALAEKVHLNFLIAPLVLPIETAVPCGLILNELAGNALKHAFPDGRGGEVTVALQLDPATATVCLRVSDNGVGLPAGMDWRQSGSLGLRLAHILAGQLRGTLETGTGPGTEFRVTFCLNG